jgi:hypothetical protein
MQPDKLSNSSGLVLWEMLPDGWINQPWMLVCVIYGAFNDVPPKNYNPSAVPAPDYTQPDLLLYRTHKNI